MARIKYYDAAEKAWKYADDVILAPVQSVNGQTGTVVLNAQNVGAEESGTVEAHNSSAAAHADIRSAINTLEGKMMLKSDISVKKAKLTLEDGTEVLIDVVVASDGTTIQKYTNQVPLSVDTTGAVFNSTGYQNGYRLSSSGVTKALASSAVTGYIPAKSGDTISIFNCGWGTLDHGMNYIAAYDSSFTFIGAALSNSGPDHGTAMTELETNWTLEENGDATLKLAAVANIAYIRVSSRGMTSTTTVDGADMIVTVNEEIS